MESADRARGFSYALVYSWTANNPPDVKVGEFEDEFVRTPEGKLAANYANYTN